MSQSYILPCINHSHPPVLESKLNSLYYAYGKYTKMFKVDIKKT